MVEALLVTAIGSMGGIVLFFVLRPLVAMIPLDATTWWPEAIVPPIPAAVVMLLAVQVVGAVGALVTMRRLVITPLGVQRRSVPSRPGVARLAPLVLALGALLLAVSLYRNRDLADALKLAFVGGAFAADDRCDRLRGTVAHRRRSAPSSTGSRPADRPCSRPGGCPTSRAARSGRSPG